MPAVLATAGIFFVRPVGRICLRVILNAFQESLLATPRSPEQLRFA